MENGEAFLVHLSIFCAMEEKEKIQDGVMIIICLLDLVVGCVGFV